jgi:hypothetical protein
VVPVAADWNDSHIFNQRWPSHARFHGVVVLAMTSGLAGLNLSSLCCPQLTAHQPPVRGGRPGRLLAPFLVAPLVRGPGWTIRRTRSPGSWA